MNFRFSTDSERIATISNLRRPEIVFPEDWDVRRERQRQSRCFLIRHGALADYMCAVITWLLQHDPDDRPDAVELSQSKLLPPRVEEEYLKDALEMMGRSACDQLFPC